MTLCPHNCGQRCVHIKTRWRFSLHGRAHHKLTCFPNAHNECATIVVTVLPAHRLDLTGGPVYNVHCTCRLQLVDEGTSGERLVCAPPPPRIEICRPYLELARFARQNLSVEIPFYLKVKFELIINFVNFYHKRSILKKK